MPEQINTEPLASPEVKQSSGLSMIWLIPLITLIIGGWLVLKTLAEQGPQISISFKTAEGIEAGKTRIKYKNVEIGVVDSVSFSDDFNHVILNASFAQGTEPFLRRDTKFWVVKPRLSVRGVSGLGTLVSGAYLEIEPGQGVARKHFHGLEKPPVIKANEAGTKINLIADKLGSLDTGSLLYYQGINAGEVLGYELGNDNKSIYIHAFVRSPFDQLVRSNSRFWNVSGMDISLGADGLSVETESMQSLVFGGIAFDTPSQFEQSNDEIESLVFTLHDSYSKIQEFAYTKKVQFVLYFDSSVRGLTIGAPVEFKGIKIGSVIDVHLEFTRDNSDFFIPVTIEIEPERIQLRDSLNDGFSAQKMLADLVSKGLRAQLSTGSLITGQLFVELDMLPDSPAQYVAVDNKIPELPTVSGGIASMTSAIQGFLANLEKVQVDKIGNELLKTLEGTSALANAPALPEAINNLQATMASLQSVMKKIDQANLENAINSGNNALVESETTLTLLNDMLNPDAPFQSSVILMAQELEETVRSIRTLIDLLERNPESLLFGREPRGE